MYILGTKVGNLVMENGKPMDGKNVSISCCRETILFLIQSAQVSCLCSY